MNAIPHPLRVQDLPPPPAGRTGWPWTEAPAPEPADVVQPITVVTPSFNQGQFIEETIRSVLLQGYPQLEYMVLDGGSTDGSVEIIQRYSPWLSYWRSARDHGQADAISEGLQRAHGTMFNWINSDDSLLPGALPEVNRLSENADIVAGVCINIHADNKREPVASRGLDACAMLKGSGPIAFHQPAIWLRRTALMDSGGIDPSMDYVFDWEMLIRLLAHGARVAYTDRPLAEFKLHEQSKTVSAPIAFERERRRAVVRLAQTLPAGAARAEAVRLARTYRWWYVLAALQRQSGSARRRVWRVIRAALREPGIRITRLTLGGILRAARLRHRR